MSVSPVGIDYKEWADRYDIGLHKIECPTCKKKFVPTEPLAIQGYRGLALSDHGCGPNMPFTVVPVGERVAFWESLRLALIGPYQGE